MQYQILKLETEKNCLQQVIDGYLQTRQDIEQNNITLNIEEKVTNWSLFNVFDTKKKNKEETRKYHIQLDKPNQNEKKEETKIHLWQGTMFRQDSLRASEIQMESNIKAPSGIHPSTTTFHNKNQKAGKGVLIPYIQESAEPSDCEK